MWGSIPALETLASAAFWVGVIAGSIALIAGAALTVTSDRIAALTKAEADLKISDANTRAAEANARAEEAKADAAKAHQRAEEAGAETEKVRERLQKSQEIRRLSGPQADALGTFLRSDLFHKEPKPRLQVSSVPDAESQMYAMDFLNLFKACGVNVYPTRDGKLPNEYVQLQPTEKGLALSVGTLEACEEVQPFTRLERLMLAVGLPMNIERDPSLASNQAVLQVLRKPAATG